ncbi:MAG: transposase [Candidatus Saccharibacteria bacterium]
MPGRNIVKRYSTDSYYHVYNRGVEKRAIFIDDQDYAVFVALLKRYLDINADGGSRGRSYVDVKDGVDVISFCLMPNHFHLLLYQIELGAITKLMRAVCSSYSTYFNKKYQRVGALFQGKFRAVPVLSNAYLQYISRYIHLNPTNYLDWEWSSLKYWLGDKSALWIKPERINDMDRNQYLDYLQDDNDFINSVEEISDVVFDND